MEPLVERLQPLLSAAMHYAEQVAVSARSATEHPTVQGATTPHTLLLATIVLLSVWRLATWAVLARARSNARSIRREYDVIVIGASIAGPAAAIQLARQGRKVLVIESDLSRPDRIVGELLQPGGIQVLREMGMEDCALSVGQRCTGYVARFEDEWVDLPYDQSWSGVSFHFGDFVMNLRQRMLGFNASEEAAKTGGTIDVVEGTAQELLREASQRIVVGVKYKRKADNTSHYGTAHLTVLCDGGYSKFRPTKKRVTPHSYFVGIILRGLEMPYETKGHVMLAKNGPVLSYRLDANEVRILADHHCRSHRAPSNADLARWLQEEILPQLPPAYQKCLSEELERAKTDRHLIRSHPHYHFSPIFQKCRGVVAIGDSGNQRHPLTGAGMTCALRDAFNLAKGLRSIPYLGDDERVHSVVLSFLRNRPRFTSVLNLLSWALHGVFRGPMALRRACFAYFQLGGDCVRVPMAFLSAINASLTLLLYHYVRVTVYGAWIVLLGGGKESAVRAGLGLLNPLRWFNAVHLYLTATWIFAPLLVTEFGSTSRIVDPTTLWPW